MVVDKRWQTPVRAHIDVRRLFGIIESEEGGVVGKPELLEDSYNFPRVGTRSVGVEGELLSVVWGGSHRDIGIWWWWMLE